MKEGNKAKTNHEISWLVSLRTIWATHYLLPCFLLPIAHPSVENEDQPTSLRRGEGQTAGSRLVINRRCWIELAVVGLHSPLLGFIRRCWVLFAFVGPNSLWLCARVDVVRVATVGVS
jgi:hypothetical protein